MKIDFSQYLDLLGKEKFRSIIIYSDSYDALSQFALKAVRKYNGKLLDILDYFKKNKELASKLDIFDIEKLISLLKEVSATESFLFIYKIDFILDTWHKKEKDAFYRMIRNQWNSFFDDMKATLIFLSETVIFLNVFSLSVFVPSKYTVKMYSPGSSKYSSADICHGSSPK